jgi:hypothetical protein
MRVPFSLARARALSLSLCPLCGNTVALAARLLGDADWSDMPSTVEPDMEDVVHVARRRRSSIDHRLEHHFQRILVRNAEIHEQRASSSAKWTICRLISGTNVSQL